MNKDYLTIKEVAKIVDISPQAIYQRLDKDLKSYFKVVNNKKCLSCAVLDVLIKQPLNPVDKEVDNNFKEVLNLLERQIEEKDRQLAIKDKQIEQFQKLLDQQQQLTLLNKNKVQQIESKSHWWQRNKF